MKSHFLKLFDTLPDKLRLLEGSESCCSVFILVFFIAD